MKDAAIADAHALMRRARQDEGLSIHDALRRYRVVLIGVVDTFVVLYSKP
ncbi:MAG TPA: hypothetical protein VFG33_09900 [Kribbella sp.]|nr:hypothetical protein [Kribbella sp.]HET6293680.1 hypothetical protein [Kribbella sp.]